MNLQISKTNSQEPLYYHREYENDVGKKSEKGLSEQSWLDVSKRVALVSLPFISLYKPLSFPLSLTLGGLRAASSVVQLLDSISKGETKEIPFQMLQTAISVIALAGTIFAHPLGMLITTGHDILVELSNFVMHARNGEYQKAMESFANITNHALYFALFLHGGLEIGIASLAMQIVLGLYHSHTEFRKGNYIEGFGHLLMSMVRGNQLTGQARMLQTKWKIENSLKEIKAQELQEKSTIRSLSSDAQSRKKIEASKNGKISKVSSDAVKSQNNAEYSKLLNRAKAENNQELVDILVKYGNNPDKIHTLNYAVKVGDERAVKILLENGANINQPSRLGVPLEIALREHHLKLASFLFEHNAMATPLAASICCKNHFFNQLQMLLKGNPQIINHQELVTICCESAFLNGLEFLFKNGAKIPNNFTSNQVLFKLLSKGDPKYVPIVKYMINKGADCRYIVPVRYDIPYRKECVIFCSVGLITPALNFGDDELIQILIKNQAPLNCLIQVYYNNQLVVMENPGIYLNFLDDQQRFHILHSDPLYKSALDGKLDIAKLLIHSGAKREPWLDTVFNNLIIRTSKTMNPQNNDYFDRVRKCIELGFLNQTPYFWDMMKYAITEKNDLNWVTLLYSLGAKIENDYLKLAIEKGNKEIITFLLEHGATIDGV